MVEVRDVILKRYGNIDFFMELEYKESIEQYNKVIEKNIEDRLWDVWLAQYPNMTKETFISFEDFVKQNTKNLYTNNQPKKSSKELIEWAESIKKTPYTTETIP